MKTKSTPTKALLKAIDQQLQTILENDIRKLHLANDPRIKNAAFLQLIAA
jgi:hypothetical protein